MVIDVNELVEVVEKMVWKECKKRGIKADEDVIQDVLLRMWRLVKKSGGGVREEWTGYVWRVVNSVLNDLLRERNLRSRIVYLEDMRGEDESKVDEYVVDKDNESFSVKLVEVIGRYLELIDDDFLKLVTGDIDVSNALRSVSQSRKKGVEWIEWWLGRKLSEEEVMCCEDIKAIL
jgi:hypothetical protein